MNSKEHFDHFYKINAGPIYSKSLLDFFEQMVRPRLPGLPDQLKILDIGCGSYSLFEVIENLNAEITAIDFSSEAINKAPQSKIRYRCSNVVDPEYFQAERFDLVFDSHCLNCIIDENERSRALLNIHRSLKNGGLFASELMVQPTGLTVSMPFKLIKTSIDLEKEILDHGFKIIYFVIVRDIKFTSEVDGEEMNCDVLRLIAKK